MVRTPFANIPRETPVVVGLISGSEFINHMYLTLLPPVLGVMVVEFDTSLAALGFAIGVQAFVNTVFQLPFGYLSDHYDRTLTLGICLFLGAAGTFLLAMAPTYEWLLVGQIVLGIGIAGHHPAHYPLLSDATPTRLRGRSFAVLGFAGNIGFAAPAAIIVAVASFPGLSWRHGFALIGAIGLGYLLIVLYVLLVHIPPDVRRPHPAGAEASTAGRSVSERFREELRALLRSPVILALGVLAMVLSVTMWGVAAFVVTLLVQEYLVSTTLASLTLTAMFMAGALFKLVGGALADRIGSVAVIVGSAVISGGLILVLASLLIPPLLAVVIAIVGGNLVVMSNPARDKLTDVLSARTDLGRNFAIITIGLMIGNTVAPPLFGYIIDTAGFRIAFISIALVAFSVVVLVGGIVTRLADDLSQLDSL